MLSNLNPNLNKDIKILVVDDLINMRKIAKDLLKKLGFHNIFEAEDGHHALLILKKSGDFDFLITDWNMPNMNGFELLQAVRLDQKLKTLPVLMVTSEANRKQIIKAAEAGVDGYIIKPLTINILSEKIEKIFANRQ